MYRTPGPWQHLADSYFAGSPTASRVESHFDEIEQRYGDLRHKTDVLADDLGRAIIEKRIKRADFEKALDLGVEAVPDAPAELVAFMESATRLPQWLDMAAVERGADVFRQIPALSSVLHSVIGGFVFASIAPESAITLSLNKNLITATNQRYIRSFKYMADAAAPGGLHRFSAGFKSACRVRLVHGFVRSEIANHYDWNYAAYDSPINSSHVVFTSLITSSYVIPYAESFGLRFSDREKDDLCMHTAYLAFLQGVSSEDIPLTYKEASEFTYYYLTVARLPLPADIERSFMVLGPLTKNGFPVSSNKWISKIFNGYLNEETWRMFGKEICSQFAVPRNPSARVYAPVLRLLNICLAKMRAIKMLKPYYRSFVQSYWDKTVPHMLEQLTGHLDVSFADSAAVKKS